MCIQVCQIYNFITGFQMHLVCPKDAGWGTWGIPEAVPGDRAIGSSPPHLCPHVPPTRGV